MDTSNYTTMMEALACVGDPRARRGMRYTWALLLALVGGVMVAGDRHGRAIAELFAVESWMPSEIGTRCAALSRKGGAETPKVLEE